MVGRQAWIAVVGWVGLIGPGGASAQVVGYVPNVAGFPNGAILSATPVVSADRRYVRLGVVPQFTEIEGFDRFPVPAAVSGGPGNGPGPGNFDVGADAMGFAGMNGPLAGPYDPESSGRAGGVRRRFGPARASSSTDFEDQDWPEAAATTRPAPPLPFTNPKPRRKKTTRQPLRPAATSRPSAKR